MGARYKINMQKPVTLTYTNNIRQEKVPFKIVINNVKYRNKWKCSKLT